MAIIGELILRALRRACRADREKLIALFLFGSSTAYAAKTLCRNARTCASIKNENVH